MMKRIPTRRNGLLGCDERNLLRSLLGQDVFLIFTPWLGASFDHFECGPLSFALRTSNDFIVLDQVWEEDENLSDFGWLTVNREVRAKGIDYSKDGNPLSGSHISLTPSSPIAKVTVFRKREDPDWVFDYALLFEHEERFRYVISYQPSAFQRIVVSFSESSISRELCNLPFEAI